MEHFLRVWIDVPKRVVDFSLGVFVLPLVSEWTPPILNYLYEINRIAQKRDRKWTIYFAVEDPEPLVMRE